jgi:hypothetical protein
MDKSLISVENIGFFKLGHPKVGIDIFYDFFKLLNFRGFSLQTQQGHFHPWPF